MSQPENPAQTLRDLRVQNGQAIDQPCLFPPSAAAVHAGKLLQEAFGNASRGDVDGARVRLAEIDDGRKEYALWDWWWLGQAPKSAFMASLAPYKKVEAAWAAALVKNPRDPRRNPTASAKSAVFARDGFRCRYCGMPVADRNQFKRLRELVGVEALPLGRINTEQHEAVLTLTAIADHVVPWAYGGRTDPSNLVTCCGVCNYGKFNMSLEMLGLADPFSRPPHDAWDGGHGLQESKP